MKKLLFILLLTPLLFFGGIRFFLNLNDIPIYEKNFSLVDTYGADEAFLTGTFGAQTPVIELDGRPIGDGGMGLVTTKIHGLYKDLIGRVTA